MSHRTDNLRGTEGPQSSRPPELGGIRLGQSLTLLLYVLLVGSAGLSLFGRRFPGFLPGLLERIVPWLFLVFVVVFAFYRFGLVKAGKYPVFKGFWQVGLTVMVWLLLFPSNRIAFRRPEPSLADAIGDNNVRVRLLAAEVAGYRADGARYAPTLVRALEDGDARVRTEAHASLVRLNGSDLGSAEDTNARRAWKERYP